MTQRPTTATRRSAATVLLAVLGGAIVVATWIGGARLLALGIAAFYLVCCVVTYGWAGRSGDVAALLRASGDERQRQLDVRATAYAGIATLVFCLVGTVVDLARGGSGNPWALICAVGGVAYAASLAYLRRTG